MERAERGGGAGSPSARVVDVDEGDAHTGPGGGAQEEEEEERRTEGWSKLRNLFELLTFGSFFVVVCVIVYFEDNVESAWEMRESLTQRLIAGEAWNRVAGVASFWAWVHASLILALYCQQAGGAPGTAPACSGPWDGALGYGAAGFGNGSCVCNHLWEPGEQPHRAHAGEHPSR